MRNLVCGLLCFVLFYSCKKDSGCGYSDRNTVAPLAEQQAVKDFLTSNNVNTALKDSSGFYYEIIDDGSGSGAPGLCSQVELSYTGQLTNGHVFDQANTAFTLGATIEGLRKGLPLIKKGGHIKLYIPPTLAYGSADVKDNSGTVVIPANSILIFDITMTSFYWVHRPRVAEALAEAQALAKADQAVAEEQTPLGSAPGKLVQGPQVQELSAKN